MSKGVISKDEDYSQWYNDLVIKADMAEYSPVKGCMIIKPWGYGLWENMQKILDSKIKETGHQNAYFPLFIPLSFLEKEAEHVEGFAEGEVCLGDQVGIGTCVLQVSQPRQPCFKLMAKMNDFNFARPFLASGRTGFYLRVMEEGEIGAGDAIERVTTDAEEPTIREVVLQMIDE